jgi:tRNA pseudouridine65 synthase
LLPILYRDDRVVVIDKPPGLLVHRSQVDRRETRFAIQLLRDQIGRRVWPAHRLDRGTSGVLIFGLDPETAAFLGRQFASGEIAKTYRALVRGHPPEQLTIDHPLDRVEDPYLLGPSPSSGTQEACTRLRRLARFELDIPIDRYPTSRYALVELLPETGRRHQLRRHLKHIAHPIIGDATYGKGRHNRFFAEHFDCHRLLLACTGLVWRHPDDGRGIETKTPVGDTFAATLALLGWTDDQ